jgi:hypothetical protein
MDITNTPRSAFANLEGLSQEAKDGLADVILNNTWNKVLFKIAERPQDVEAAPQRDAANVTT